MINPTGTAPDLGKSARHLVRLWAKVAVVTAKDDELTDVSQ